MIDLSPAQAASRIVTLLKTSESQTLEFKRVSGKMVGNLERPSVWSEVSDWIDRHGSIANADLCRIAKVETLKASKMLGGWVGQGVLEALPDRGKRNMAYTKPAQGGEQPSLLSELADNNRDES